MTNEEAKEKLKDILAEATEDEDAVCYVTSDDADVLKVAIQALEQEPILEKIREEIEQLRLHKAEFLTSDSKVCIDSQAVLDIIDKYKAESEG